MKAYLLQHVHTINDDEDVKITGIYSSYDKAIAAINRLKQKPGFRDNPELIDPSLGDKFNGFVIDIYVLDEDNWIEGFITE